MHVTAKHPAELETALASIGLSDLLDGYVARERVGVRFLALERFAQQHGYEFRREHGNLYGRLQLVPAAAAPAPVMRLITRSDHAAVHGDRTDGVRPVWRRQRAL